jgi:AsmA protein
MKRRCLRCLIPLGIAAVPLLVWMLILLILPTDWARARIVERLSQASGRTVRLESLGVGFLGGVHLKNLSIGAPQAAGDPWLSVAQATANINLIHLLSGHIDPTEIEVDGISLRVRRRRDGTFELSDLIQAVPGGAGSESGDPECPGPTGLDVVVRNARIEVVDEPTQTRLEFKDIEGRATCAGRRATVQNLKGTINGGTFELVAQLDRTGPIPVFEGQIRTQHVTMGEGMNALAYLLAPALAGSSHALDGQLALDLYLRGRATRDALQESLVGHGTVVLDPVQLSDSKLLAQLAPVAELPDGGRVGSVRSNFAIKERRIVSDDLTVSLGNVPLVFEGATGFDGRMSYRLKPEGLAERLPGRARDVLAELAVNLDDLAVVRVQGTIDNMVVRVDDGSSVDGRHHRDDRQRFRDLGKKLRDRVLR